MKIPRLFYWQDAVSDWLPFDIEMLDEAGLLEDIAQDGAMHPIRFKRIDMTDAEFENLPEA